jgi:hypothetical protein
MASFNQQQDRFASHPNTEVDVEKNKIGAEVDVRLIVELNSAWKNLRESVDQAHRKLPQASDSLVAFMKHAYPHHITIKVTQKKAKNR